MTDNEINKVIREKCGADCNHFESAHPITEEGSSITTLLKCKKCGVVINLHSENWPAKPDYPNDLNAMHEAEKTLVPDKFGQYLDRLREITQSENRYEVENRFELVHATARQRSIAFIKTVCPEKWKGNE